MIMDCFYKTLREEQYHSSKSIICIKMQNVLPIMQHFILWSVLNFVESSKKNAFVLPSCPASMKPIQSFCSTESPTSTTGSST